MKHFLFSLVFLLPFSALAQITSIVTADQNDYAYGEIIKITMTVSNNSADSVITYKGSSTGLTMVLSFSGTALIPDIFTTDEIRDSIHVGETREVRWQLDPSELALPNKDGTQTVVVKTLSVVDSVTFNAPKFTGGKIDLYFKEDTDIEIINQIKDSLHATVLKADHPSYRWKFTNFMADTVLSNLLKRDYVLEANIPGRGNVVAISHRTLTGTEEPDEVSELNLAQNYPNPFNPTTKIDFSVDQPSLVNLSVYDLMGRKVTEIVNKRYLQGEHSVSFNADNLSSGTYIYRLRTERGTISKKLTLIK